MSDKALVLQQRFLAVQAWFNSISSQAGINVLLIEPLLHQIKVPADGLSCSPPSAMKGIISIHYFTLSNIPIINELQPWIPTRSIMAAGATCINLGQKQVCGSSARDKLIIRFTMMNRYISTDGTSEEVQWKLAQGFNICNQKKKDVNPFRGCRYVVFSFPFAQLLVVTKIFAGFGFLGVIGN